MFNKIKSKLSYEKYTPLVYDINLRNAYLSSSVCGGTLKGKRVLISGATGGIGLALAERYASEGSILYLIGRNKEKLEDTSKAVNEIYNHSEIHQLCFDLMNSSTAEENINHVFDNSGIDIFISNAGVFFKNDQQRVFRSYSQEEFQQSWSLNVQANCHICGHVAERMKEKGIHGKIVIISSICAQQQKFQYTPYGMSKAVLLEYSNLLQEMYPDLDIITVLPGAVATKMGNYKMGDNVSAEGNQLNHVILPEEIASISAFFSSEISSYLNGGGGDCPKTNSLTSSC